MIKEIIGSIKSGIKLLITKPITYNFPPEMPLAEEFRGRHIFDPKKCTSCNLCSRICPNKAIQMVERKGSTSSQDSQARAIRHPQIDYTKCCFCGLCADICPTEALRMTNFPMLISLDKKDLLFTPEKLAQPPELKMPEKTRIKNVASWARSRSLWVINFFTGCGFIEVIPWVSSGFDMERFGLLVADSPRHADMFIIAGYVTVKTLKRIIRIYQQMPQPKFVIALGNCPMSGGTYWDSYNTVKRIDDYIPVDMWIAGCPPRPEAIGFAVVAAMNAIQSGYTGKKEEVKAPKKLKPPTIMREKLEEGEFLLPFGPQHPASGNFQLKLKVDGETVTQAEPQIGYLHRGFEKLMEYRTWMQNILLVPRICVLDGAPYEIAYSNAVEELAEIEIPERAKYLRVIQAEFSRIQSHLLNFGLIGEAAGFHTMQKVMWGDREKILFLLERLTGGRVYQLYSVPGGVRRDVPEEFKSQTLETITYMQKRVKMYDEFFLENPVFRKRTINVGRVSSKIALENDVTGPNLRASGRKIDVRKSTPYAAYNELDFEVPTFKEGDAYHRTLLRRLEIDESLNMVEEALNKLPIGGFRVRFAPFKSIPEGEALRCVESARGELCFHIVSSRANTPCRVKVRGPTFDSILVMLPKMLKGAHVADVPVIYWSLDNCPADHDR